MKALALGTICHLVEASAFTMTQYNHYKNKGFSSLKCPCKIPKTKELKVIEHLSDKLAMVCYKDNPSIMTICSWGDLEKL